MRSIVILLALLNLLLGIRVQCSEYRISTYFPGFRDVLVGVQPPPGFYLQERTLFYTGNVSRTLSAGRIAENAHVYIPVQFTLLESVTKTKVWGSYYAFGLIFPIVEPQISGTVQTPFGSRSFTQSISGLSQTQILPLVLGWHSGKSYQRAAMVVYAPTGNYDPLRAANTTLNRWAIEFDYGYTYLDRKTGVELDVAPGYTFNFRNPDTDYTSGQEFHIDFAALQHLSTSWAIGAVGYMFFQTTPDTGPGAILGANEGRTFALGPIAFYRSRLGGIPMTVTGKYYGEFGVSNRYAGHSYWFNMGFAF